MKTRILQTLLLIVIISGMLFLGTPVRSVRAATGCPWNGSIDAKWSTPGNWGSGCSGAGGIPGTGDTLTFPSGTLNTSMNDDLPSITLTKLTFTSSLGYNLSGTNTISLTGGIDVQGGNQTINTPLAMANNSVLFQVASGSNLSLGGTLNLGSYTLTATVNTAAGVTGLEILNKVTGGTYTSLGKISKGGSGDLRFFNDDSLVYWDIDLNAGTISTDPAAGTYLPNNGTITLASGTNLNLLSGDVIGSIAGSGNIHASSYFQIRQYKTTTFTGDIFGNQQMAIVGGGVLTINRSGGSLSYTGEINVNVGPGHLILINTTATSVSDFLVAGGYGSNAVLELNGSHVGVIKMGYPDPNQLYSGTILLSGMSANSATHVTVQTASCTISSVINSASDYGRLTVTSPVDLGSNPVTFSLNGSYAPKPGEVFNIIHNTNSGTATLSNVAFSGLPQGGTLPFNSVVLTADYQATGNTAFALVALGIRLYLPLIFR
jgi:hypothetical protein